MEIRIHPELAALMPARTEQEDRELKDSIEHYGVREPITVAEVDGVYVIVDGHNRYRVATALGVDFETREFEFENLGAAHGAIEHAKQQLAAARETMEVLEYKNREMPTLERSKLVKVEDVDNARQRVEHLEAKVEELEGSTDERIQRAKLDEIKLYMIRDALARRNVTPTDKVILTRAAKEIVYKREAHEARLSKLRNQSSSPSIEANESTKRVTQQIANDSGVSRGTTERVMFVEDVANGKREDFADKRELAAQQLAEMRRGELAPSAAEKAIRQGMTDTEAARPTASVPEDVLCRWMSDKRGWNTPAIATRYKALYNDADQLADWLEELAAKLRESE